MHDLIRAGLSTTPKTLPAALLYDDLGSTLFEAITLLPEYEVARVDAAMLAAHAETATARAGGPLELVELGPGHGRKARIVLGPVTGRQAATRFFAVDISSAALDGCKKHLEDLTSVEVVPIEATFVEGLGRLPARQPGHRRLVLFLGSNLSNFDRAESLRFLRDVRATLEPGDALLFSADLEKEPARLLPAYDDALGVTAAFNKNVLVHLNRAWGASFELPNFAHEARWNPEARRIEMHLRALRACDVRVEALGLDLHFDEGETLWTESSHRFNTAELARWATEARFEVGELWVDDAWPLALTLLVAR